MAAAVVRAQLRYDASKEALYAWQFCRSPMAWFRALRSCHAAQKECSQPDWHSQNWWFPDGNLDHVGAPNGRLEKCQVRAIEAVGAITTFQLGTRWCHERGYAIMDLNERAKLVAIDGGRTGVVSTGIQIISVPRLALDYDALRWMPRDDEVPRWYHPAPLFLRRDKFLDVAKQRGADARQALDMCHEAEEVGIKLGLVLNMHAISKGEVCVFVTAERILEIGKLMDAGDMLCAAGLEEEYVASAKGLSYALNFRDGIYKVDFVVLPSGCKPNPRIRSEIFESIKADLEKCCIGYVEQDLKCFKVDDYEDERFIPLNGDILY